MDTSKLSLNYSRRDTITMERLLQDVLHTEIPITRAMGIRVVQATSQSVTLSAPLQNNRNHKYTAFGGSLYSAAVLSGWGVAIPVFA